MALFEMPQFDYLIPNGYIFNYGKYYFADIIFYFHMMNVVGD